MMILAWPLDNRDYLTVCDVHPTRYVSCSARLVQMGEAEPDAPDPFNPPRYVNDYQIIATSPHLLEWTSLKQLAALMECSPREVASLAHHLKRACDAGLLGREQRRVQSNGRPRLFWFYRRPLVESWSS